MYRLQPGALGEPAGPGQRVPRHRDAVPPVLRGSRAAVPFRTAALPAPARPLAVGRAVHASVGAAAQSTSLPRSEPDFSPVQRRYPSADSARHAQPTLVMASTTGAPSRLNPTT